MVDLMAGTGGALMAFLDYTSDKGLVHKETVKAIKVSVREILAQVQGPDWESQDVRGLDAEDVLQRFDTRSAGKFSPKSLQSYHGRFRRALVMYSEYVQDPGGWRPAKQPRSSTGTARRRDPGQPSGQATPPQHQTPPGDDAVDRPDMMTYPFPIRRDGTVLFARLILPHDLTAREAERIGEHIKTLVEEPESPKSKPTSDPKPDPEQDDAPF